jgi:hypothetical protein
MSRRLRYIPEGGALVEVTCRTVQSRFLLRPGPELNDLVVGVFGRAQRLYEGDEDTAQKLHALGGHLRAR